MATRGVFQLKKLTVKYCEHSGSSRGTREFIRHHIVEFANRTPAAEVVTELRPGQHPFIVGEYITGSNKVIGIKNLPPKDIMGYAMMLRNTSGRKVSVQASTVRIGLSIRRTMAVDSVTGAVSLQTNTLLVCRCQG